jgi:hypothetical protein
MRRGASSARTRAPSSRDEHRGALVHQPLDAREAGFSGTIGVKALYDTSVEKSLSDPAKITGPECFKVLKKRKDGHHYQVFTHGAGHIYHYPNVERATFEAFRGAESIGTYFGQHLNALPFEKFPAERSS